MSTTRPQRFPQDTTVVGLEALSRRAAEPRGFERELLAVVVEQVAIRSDQLVRLLRVDADGVAEALRCLESGGWLRRRRVFEGEAEWASPTTAGCRFFGVRFVRWELRFLDHRYYVNEARIHLSDQVPDGRWTAERFQRPKGGGRRGGEVPDGVLEAAGARYGIEVELSPKTRDALRLRVASKAAAYDALVYFCGKLTYGRVRDAVAGLGLGNVSVRRLEFQPPRGRRPLPRASKEPLTPTELAAARVVSEQGAVRVDHLAGFLSVSMAEAEEIAGFCAGRGTLGRRPGVVGEPDWLWARVRGVRGVGNGLRHQREVSPGMFARMLSVNDCRLRAEAAEPGGRWESSRVYASREAARRGVRSPKEVSSPDGVFIAGDGARTAYLVVTTGASDPRPRRRLVEYSSRFDRVVCVSRPRTCSALGAVMASEGIGNVEFRDLAGSVVEARVGGRPTPRSHRSRGTAPDPEALGAAVRSVVGLVAEEGYLWRGSLVGLTGRPPAELEKAVSVGLLTGLLREDWLDGAGRPILAATTWGCQVHGGGLRAPCAPAAGRRIGRAEVLVQARIELWAGVPGAAWASERTLGAGGGRPAHRLRAAVERGGQTFAVEVQLGKMNRERMRCRLASLRRRVDGVIVFCTRKAVPEMEALIAAEGWERFELRAVSAEIEALL
jgi:hypothetical protein